MISLPRSKRWAARALTDRCGCGLIVDPDMTEVTAEVHRAVRTMIGAEDELLSGAACGGASARLALRVLRMGAIAAFCFVAIAALYVRRTVAQLRHRTQELARSEARCARKVRSCSRLRCDRRGRDCGASLDFHATLNPAARRFLR